jgi:uncharacterized membrane protein YqgA involved in biofilm formation
MRRCVLRKEHARTGGVRALDIAAPVFIALIFAALFGTAVFLLALVIFALRLACSTAAASVEKLAQLDHARLA